MPALMAKRSSSAMLNKIRREFERRRKAINIAKGGIAKKSSPAPPPSLLIPSGSGAGATTLKLSNAPKEGVAKKTSAPLPHPRVLIPTAPPGAATNKIAYLDMGEAPKRYTAPPRRSALIPSAMTMKVAKSTATTALIPHQASATKLSTHKTAGAETEYIKMPSSVLIQPRSSSISVKKGMAVKVRGPARTLRTGQRIVILHSAVVVSDVEDGYLEVVYSGNYPRDGTVRIPLDQVKMKMTPSK